MNLTTTLKKLRENDNCKDCYNHLSDKLGKDYGDDTEVTLLQILDLNGLDDALRSLCAMNEDKLSRFLARDLEDHAIHVFEEKYPGDNRPRQAIEVSRRFTNGKATCEERDAAISAAHAAWGAVELEIMDTEIKWQEQRLREFVEDQSQSCEG